MIDAGPSLALAERLNASELASYLAATGWNARPSRSADFTIFSKVVEGADRLAEFILPNRPGFEEEKRRIADALRTLEAIEERSMSDVVDDVLGTRPPRPVVRKDSKKMRAAVGQGRR